MTPAGACPVHGPLPGLGTYCERCERYVEDMEGALAATGAGGASKRAPKDTRLEEERKADARPTVEALGWTVLDLEQGWRPFTCKHCGGDIAGGTHVPKGTPDWLVMGHGVVAWIEWKSGTGTLSRHQKAFRDACEDAGVPWAMARTTEDAVTFLQDQKQRRAS